MRLSHLGSLSLAILIIALAGGSWGQEPRQAPRGDPGCCREPSQAAPAQPEPQAGKAHQQEIRGTQPHPDSPGKGEAPRDDRPGSTQPAGSGKSKETAKEEDTGY